MAPYGARKYGRRFTWETSPPLLARLHFYCELLWYKKQGVHLLQGENIETKYYHREKLMLSIKIRRKHDSFRMLCVTLTGVEWWPALPVMGQIINILDWCATLFLSQLLILTGAEKNLLQTMQKQIVCLPCRKPLSWAVHSARVWPHTAWAPTVKEYRGWAFCL